jgi:hypothetical protein
VKKFQINCQLRSKLFIVIFHFLHVKAEVNAPHLCKDFLPAVVRTGSAHPLTQWLVMPPLLAPWGTHSLAGEGVVGPDSDKGTDTVIL